MMLIQKTKGKILQGWFTTFRKTDTRKYESPSEKSREFKQLSKTVVAGSQFTHTEHTTYRTLIR
jgi:hypothetical protein